MNIIWDIQENDIIKVKDLVDQHQNALVNVRVSKNINHLNVRIDKNIILKTQIMCLLTSQQSSGPNSLIGLFLGRRPFPFTEEIISTESNIENFARLTLQQNGLTRFINKISEYFVANYDWLCKNNWRIINDLENLKEHGTKNLERNMGDYLQEIFKGFGPKQSRNFLQELGLTKFEIPIDSRVINWLNEFGFPVKLNSASLQDQGYYHFVSEGIQILCERANIYPCIFDAAIFSSFDNNQWTE